jgi:uncharacterized protein (TIGR02118 family)
MKIFSVHDSMNYCLFLLAQKTQAATEATGEEPLPQLISALRSIPGLMQLTTHRAISGVHDPAIKTVAGPDRAFQLYFDGLLGLEHLLTPDSVLDRALGSRDAPLRRHFHWCHQAMAVRRYQLHGHPSRSETADQHGCTYFVSYEGRSADDEKWLAHYLRHHPPIMKKLPGLRKLEVYSRIDYCSDLDIEKSRSLQRNIVMFDSQHQLNDALNSSVREELRADYDGFPPFEGASPHGAMMSEVFAPATRY